jgi:NitT/TauT family transport system ATP-binding protein
MSRILVDRISMVFDAQGTAREVLRDLSLDVAEGEFITSVGLLARALIAEPDVLLMDEPFAALDAHTREAMGFELLRIWQQSRKTVIFITHSADEAIILSDRIVVMGRPPHGIIADLKVGLPRPRSIEVRGLPRFAELSLEIRALLARASDEQGEMIVGQ